MNKLQILYEDNHLLVVDKPADLPTQPTPHSSVSLETEAKLWLKETYKKLGNVYLHAVHRLDQPVSGIVLFAKTSKALSRLQKALREHLFHKEYIATIEGGASLTEGVLEHFLIHRPFFAEVVSENTPQAKRALLHYIVLAHKRETTQVRIVLKTGRYHQIRAQFSAVGCPIVGDTKYGAKEWREAGIALKAVRLVFPHPISGEEIDIQCSGGG